MLISKSIPIYAKNHLTIRHSSRQGTRQCSIDSMNPISQHRKDSGPSSWQTALQTHHRDLCGVSTKDPDCEQWRAVASDGNNPLQHLLSHPWDSATQVSYSLSPMLPGIGHCRHFFPPGTFRHGNGLLSTYFLLVPFNFQFPFGEKGFCTRTHTH